MGVNNESTEEPTVGANNESTEGQQCEDWATSSFLRTNFYVLR